MRLKVPASLRLRYLVGAIFMAIPLFSNGQGPQLILQRPHFGNISSAFYSKDGSLIYSFCKDEKLIKVWSTHDGKLVRDINVDYGTNPYFFMPGHRNSMIVFKDTLINIYRPDGSLLMSRPFESQSLISSDTYTGNVIITNWHHGFIYLIDTQTGVVKNIASNAGSPTHCSMNGHGMVTISNSKWVHFVDCVSGLLTDSLTVHPASIFGSVGASIDKERVHAALLQNDRVSILSLAHKDTILAFNLKDVIHEVVGLECFSPDLRYAVFRSLDNVYIVDIRQKKLSNQISVKNRSCLGVSSFSDDLMQFNIDLKAALYNLLTAKFVFAWSPIEDVQHLAGRSAVFSYSESRHTITTAAMDSLYQISTSDGSIIQRINLPDKLVHNYGRRAGIDVDTSTGNILVGGRNDNINGLIYQYTSELKYINKIPDYLPGPYLHTFSIDFDAHGVLLSWGNNLNAKLWNLRNGSISIIDNTSDVIASDAEHLLSQSVDTAGKLILNLVSKSNSEPTISINTNLDQTQFFRTGGAAFLNDGKGSIILNNGRIFIWVPKDKSFISSDLKQTPFLDAVYEDYGSYILVHETNYMDDTAILYKRSTIFQQLNPTFMSGKNFVKLIEGIGCITQEGYNGPTWLDVKAIPSGNLLARATLKQKGGTNINIVTWSKNNRYCAVGYLDGLQIFEYQNGHFRNLYADTNSFREVVALEFDDQEPALYFSNSIKEMLRFDAVTCKIVKSGMRLLNLPLMIRSGGDKVAVLEDGNIIEVFNKTLELLYTLVDIDSQNWQVVLPNGYYFSKNATTKNLGFSIWPNFYPFEQFDMQFNRPDLVVEALGCEDEKYLQILKKAYQNRLDRNQLNGSADFNSSDIPKVHLLTKEIPANTSNANIDLRFIAYVPESKLKDYLVYINNVPILQGQRFSTGKSKVGDTVLQKISLALSEGKNKIQVQCRSNNGMKSLMETIYVDYHPLHSKTPKIYLIGIGLSHYLDPSKKLNFAAKDIHDIDSVLRIKYPGMISYTYINERAIRDSILAVHKKLMNTDIEDKVIIALSGHGVSNGTDFYFCTYDCDFAKPASKGLRFKALDSLLSGIPARRKLMLIDACNSGLMDQQDDSRQNVREVLNGPGKSTPENVKPISSFDLMQDLFNDVSYSNGSIVISASRSSQYASENDSAHNGIFTHFVIKGLTDPSVFDRLQSGLTVGQLKKYVSDNVSMITGGQQKPAARKDNPDYDWALW